MSNKTALGQAIPLSLRPGRRVPEGARLICAVVVDGRKVPAVELPGWFAPYHETLAGAQSHAQALDQWAQNSVARVKHLWLEPGTSAEDLNARFTSKRYQHS